MRGGQAVEHGGVEDVAIAGQGGAVIEDFVAGDGEDPADERLAVFELGELVHGGDGDVLDDVLGDLAIVGERIDEDPNGGLGTGPQSGELACGGRHG